MHNDNLEKPLITSIKGVGWQKYEKIVDCCDEEMGILSTISIDNLEQRNENVSYSCDENPGSMPTIAT